MDEQSIDDRSQMWDYVLGVGSYVNDQIQEWYALKTHQPVPGRSVMESVLGVDPGSPLPQQRMAANTTLLVVGGLVMLGIFLLTRK